MDPLSSTLNEALEFATGGNVPDEVWRVLSDARADSGEDYGGWQTQFVPDEVWHSIVEVFRQLGYESQLVTLTEFAPHLRSFLYPGSSVPGVGEEIVVGDGDKAGGIPRVRAGEEVPEAFISKRKLFGEKENREFFETQRVKLQQSVGIAKIYCSAAWAVTYCLDRNKLASPMRNVRGDCVVFYSELVADCHAVWQKVEDEIRKLGEFVVNPAAEVVSASGFFDAKDEVAFKSALEMATRLAFENSPEHPSNVYFETLAHATQARYGSYAAHVEQVCHECEQDITAANNAFLGKLERLPIVMFYNPLNVYREPTNFAPSSVLLHYAYVHLVRELSDGYVPEDYLVGLSGIVERDADFFGFSLVREAYRRMEHILEKNYSILLEQTVEQTAR